ncbi:uncharacterized protein LOC123550014 [Mercenaria mercenaria]|uniref:uncharacterized protein LOC123550014 n=1 Tax=Mercenaria mercenaria TaxID=6596 RepID=UPI001E1D6D12|nr:uncharacterized protein LOC123550014 [Mercenaria mercenaria]
MRNEIVNTHNTLRRNFAHGSEGVLVANMKKLVWKSSLEEEARRKLRLHCRLSFFHFPNSNKFSNIARDSSGNFTSDILNWFSGIKTRFYPDYNLCYPLEECGQATAVSILTYTLIYVVTSLAFYLGV